MVEKLIELGAIIFNMTGVVLIFCYGLSPVLKAMNETGGVFFHLEEETGKVKKEATSYSSKATVGLILCVVGGVLQCVSLFI